VEALDGPQRAIDYHRPDRLPRLPPRSPAQRGIPHCEPIRAAIHADGVFVIRIHVAETEADELWVALARPSLGRVDEHCAVLLDRRLLRFLERGFLEFRGADPLPPTVASELRHEPGPIGDAAVFDEIP
jgi:hypothetical protein